MVERYKHLNFRVLRLIVTCGFLSISGAILSEVPAHAQDAPAIRRPAEDALAYADLLYSKDQFALAAQQYQTFIREQPNSPNLQTAWFRLGECYLKVNQVPDAVTTFNYLINQYKKGSFVGAAAYRLAVLRFNEKDYRNALAYFQVAKDQLSDPEARLQAHFYYARSLQLTLKTKEAIAQFEAVDAAQPADKNPFHERCQLEIARLLFETGDTAKSLEKFQALAAQTTTPEIREEAIVRAALMAAESGQTEVSETLLSEALKFPDTSPWKNLARTGALFNAYSKGDYDRVIALYNTGSADTKIEVQDSSRAKLLLIVGHSFRIKGDNESAIRLYTLVDAKFRGTPEGTEAGYRMLQLLLQQGEPNFPATVKTFVENQKKIDSENPYIDMAWLMDGEWHFDKAEHAAGGPGSEFAKKNYADAAIAYRNVRVGKIEEKYKEALLYKQGWSEIEGGTPAEGIMTLSRFIQQYSKSSFASSAIAKRAMAYQLQGDTNFALDDYLDLAKRYPDAPELEFALQQTALLYARLRKVPEMVAAYRNLLERFPETKGAGEAHYWIGAGEFDQEHYETALEEFRKARELDTTLDLKATLRMVYALYQLGDVPALAAEARHFLEKAPKSEAKSEKEADTNTAKIEQIPPQILEYLGSELSKKENWKDAEFFLSTLVDPEHPEQSAASVWKLLGDCRSKLEKYTEAIQAFDQYLVMTERPSDRASAYLARGIAQLKLNDYDGARASAQESLRSQKEGRTNAESRLLLGDIAAAAGKLEDAAKEYIVVSQIFTDPEITPKALSKAIQAFRSLGDQKKIEELTKDLKASYPDYKPESASGKGQ